MKNSSIITIVFLLFLVGIVLLQIFLSKKRNKWLGLVIPLICFIFSLISVLSIPMYTTLSTTIRTETDSGVLIEEVQVEDSIEKPSIGKMLAMTTPVFLVSNIPTIILLAIYFACRENIKRKSELEKMNVQDLE
ncbi:hypothetical protein [Sedimentibacter sp.]|uniref:hypothetical protein n=1 Tax=Sedimentibacter sp. TaxID=1960295 RepID=UPI0028A759F2|nr:hypothetical protein [Sedimentibacter sp.]